MSDDPWDISNYKPVLDKITVERNNPRRMMNGGNPRARGQGRGTSSPRGRGGAASSSSSLSAGRGGGQAGRGSFSGHSSNAGSSYRDSDTDRPAQSSSSSSTSARAFSAFSSGRHNNYSRDTSPSPVADPDPPPPMHRTGPAYVARPQPPKPPKPVKVHTPFHIERERPYQHIPKPVALLNKAYFRTPPPPPARANALPTQEDAFRAYQKEQETITGQKPKNTPRPDKLRLVPRHVTIGTRRGKTIYSDFQHATPSVGEVEQGDVHHPFLSVNLSRTHFYFELFLEAHRDCEAMWPLAGEMLFEDVIAGGVQLEDGHHDGKDVQILTITSRRPPKYTVHLKEPVALVDGSGSGSGMTEMYGKRQATEMDFAVGETVTETAKVMISNGAIVDKRVPVVKRKEEVDAGPVSSLGRTTNNGLRFEAAHWTTFRFTFANTDRRALFQVMDKLAQLSDDDISHTIVARMAHGATQAQPLAEPSVTLPSPDLGGLNKQPFEIRYLVDTLVANGRVRTWDVAKLLTALKDHTTHLRDEGKRLHVQSRILEDLFWEEKILNIPRQVSKLAATPRPRPGQPSEHMASPRRALLTPLRLLSFPPEPETSNRVLQRYASRINQFLRVHFCDEDDALWIDWAYRIYDNLVPSSGVLGRVRRALRSGIKIGGKHYVFLAFGESQAKERSCWFFSEDAELSADDIRKWMGDFSKEKVVAKYAARMGLCFSSTRLAMKVDMKRIKDITVVKDPTLPPGGKNQYLFTDGVGIAHPSILDQAAKTLGKTQGVDAFPSAVQFRAGGVKGVLVAWPDAPGHLRPTKKQIMVRPSMVKFLSPEKDLQVMKTSQFSFAYLNRQFITLLSYLGVDDSVFTSLFEQAVLFAQTIGNPNRVAWELQQKVPEEVASDKRVYSMSTFPIQELLDAGFGDEPLLRNVLNAVECRVLQDLKHRARIEIKQGAFLFGVVDELGVLEQGEIFVQYEDARRPDLGRHVVTAKTVVARSPALHPGDMRVAKAVDRVELHHLVNVIVFSQKGVQDLPSQLSGGDLDGDMFTVIWDQRLLPKKMAKAFDPDPPPPKTVDTEITPRDLQDYLIEFIKADNLGQIANAHLAQADRYGPSHPNCLALCQLHSNAVDYPKSGMPAVQPMNLRATEWPDFMGKTHLQAEKQYESDKTLGILFRSIQEPIMDHVADADFCDARMSSSEVEVDDSYVWYAAKMSRAYNTLLAGLMRRWALTEVEVVSGIVLKSARKRQAKDDSIKEASRDFFSDQIVRPIFHSCLDFTRSHPPKCDNPHNLDPLALFAIAAYQITSDRHLLAAYEKLDQEDRERREREARRDSVREEDEEEVEEEPVVERRGRSAKLVSFPWIFHQQLTEVARVLGEAQREREQEGWEVGTSTTANGGDEGWDVGP